MCPVFSLINRPSFVFLLFFLGGAEGGCLAFFPVADSAELLNVCVSFFLLFFFFASLDDAGLVTQKQKRRV